MSRPAPSSDGADGVSPALERVALGALILEDQLTATKRRRAGREFAPHLVDERVQLGRGVADLAPDFFDLGVEPLVPERPQPQDDVGVQRRFRDRAPVAIACIRSLAHGRRLASRLTTSTRWPGGSFRHAFNTAVATSLPS